MERQIPSYWKCAVLKNILDLTSVLTLKTLHVGLTLSTPSALQQPTHPTGNMRKPTESHQHSPTATTTSFHTMEGSGHRVFLLAKVLRFKGRKRKISTVYRKGKQKMRICFHCQNWNDCKVINYLGREIHSPSCRDTPLSFTKQIRRLKFFIPMSCHEISRLKEYPEKQNNSGYLEHKTSECL